MHARACVRECTCLRCKQEHTHAMHASAHICDACARTSACEYTRMRCMRVPVRASARACDACARECTCVRCMRVHARASAHACDARACTCVRVHARLHTCEKCACARARRRRRVDSCPFRSSEIWVPAWSIHENLPSILSTNSRSYCSWLQPSHPQVSHTNPTPILVFRTQPPSKERGCVPDAFCRVKLPWDVALRWIAVSAGPPVHTVAQRP